MRIDEQSILKLYPVTIYAFYSNLQNKILVLILKATRSQYAGVLLIDGDYIKPNFNSTCTRHV